MERESNQRAGIGSNGNTVWYDPTDPADEKRAWMSAFGMSSERYDEIKDQTQKRIDEFNAKYPLLKNLVWANGEMYYTDDAGNRIETEVALKDVTDTLKNTMREQLKDRIPNAEIETRVERLQVEIDGEDKFGLNNDQYLHYVDLADFEGDND
jgi:hypothetical protein